MLFCHILVKLKCQLFDLIEHNDNHPHNFFSSDDNVILLVVTFPDTFNEQFIVDAPATNKLVKLVYQIMFHLCSVNLKSELYDY